MLVLWMISEKLVTEIRKLLTLKVNILVIFIHIFINATE